MFCPSSVAELIEVQAVQLGEEGRRDGWIDGCPCAVGFIFFFVFFGVDSDCQVTAGNSARRSSVLNQENV